jgi:hypothetical protein
MRALSEYLKPREFSYTISITRAYQPLWFLIVFWKVFWAYRSATLKSLGQEER